MEKSLNHFDVIVIGAGSIGAPAAFYLAKSGLKTLVIDKFPSVGQGSSKRAIGGIRATHSDPAKIQICMRSLKIFSQWKETYGNEIDWLRGGYTFVAYRDKEADALKNLVIKQKGLGLNISWLNNKEILEVVPDLNPEDLMGGTFSPDDGSASPLLATHAFFINAEELGAKFHFNETVIEILTDKDCVIGVKTDRATYFSSYVINAAGPWAQQIGQMANIEIPVVPDSHEAGITKSVSQFLKPMVVDIQPGPGSSNFYFYQHSTGQIIFCITPDPSIPGFSTEETSEFLPLVSRKMIRIMPRLKNIRVRRTWRGLYPMSPDGNPIIGWAKELKGFLIAAGTCGQGFMLGPGVGELLTRFINQNLTIEDERILPSFDPNRSYNSTEILK